MKPPPRPRLAPARFLTAPGGPRDQNRDRNREQNPGWSGREKRSVLAVLRAKAALGLPEPRLRDLRERLPRRSEEEEDFGSLMAL